MPGQELVNTVDWMIGGIGVAHVTIRQSDTCAFFGNGDHSSDSHGSFLKGEALHLETHRKTKKLSAKRNQAGLTRVRSRLPAAFS